MTGEILTRMGDSISELKLIPAGHGTFDIRINGELVGEHTHGSNHEQIFPDYLEIMQMINERLSGESMGVASGAAHSTAPHGHDHDHEH